MQNVTSPNQHFCDPDVEWPSTAILWSVLNPLAGLRRNHGEHNIIGCDKTKGSDRKRDVLRISCLNVPAWSLACWVAGRGDGGLLWRPQIPSHLLCDCLPLQVAKQIASVDEVRTVQISSCMAISECQCVFATSLFKGTLDCILNEMPALDQGYSWEWAAYPISSRTQDAIHLTFCISADLQLEKVTWWASRRLRQSAMKECTKKMVGQSNLHLGKVLSPTSPGCRPVLKNVDGKFKSSQDCCRDLIGKTEYTCIPAYPDIAHFMAMSFCSTLQTLVVEHFHERPLLAY